MGTLDMLLHALGHHSYTGNVAFSAHRPVDADELRTRGAHRVLRPYEDAAAVAVMMLNRHALRLR